MDGTDSKSGWRGAAAAMLALLLAVLSAFAAAAPAPPSPPVTWQLPASDVAVDPAFRFGRLANGLRYAIRRNAHPAGQVLVRMEVAAGSLDERDGERGYAHFVEHMAFQGSTHVAPGEMIRLLERNGLAFGADTNAFTGYERTTYVLDLPRGDPDLLDTALMLLRETAGELTFAPAQVASERGVILAEKRDRDNFAFREMTARIAFHHPGARYVDRLPIGTAASLNAATAGRLRAFWRRHYVPANTTLIVIGDIDEAAATAMLERQFADWRAARAPAQPDPGPLPRNDHGRTSIYLDPALPERITLSADAAWQDEPDTIATRRTAILRAIGYGIVNRRLRSLARLARPPFRDAGLGTADTFRIGRTTNLVIDAPDGQWQRGMDAAIAEYRRALAHGFNHSEIAEQVANLRTAAGHALAGAETRSSATLANAVFALLRNDRIPSLPADDLALVDALVPAITPDSVLAALRSEAVPLVDPLIRFQGKRAPAGGQAAVRNAWTRALQAPVPPPVSDATGGFAYGDFGGAGAVVGDVREPQYGVRMVRFANGVRLNLRRTDLEKDRVLVETNVDGGALLATRENPLAVTMVPSLAAGGLGRHSQDQLQTLLAGHVVQFMLGVGAETFVLPAATTPADLALQLQVQTALISDPGYRPEGENQYRAQLHNWYATLDATPAAALGAAIGGILSDNDPRFTLQPLDAYARLSYDRLHRDLADSLGHGAIEVGIVGDIDEDAAIALVARTLGALPPRAPDFARREERRQRPWTANPAPRTLTHAGPADQALVRVTWRTRDDSDPAEKQVLNLLDRVTRLQLTEILRQKLGKAYAPAASSEPSRTYRGYGTFAIAASVNVADVAATRAAIAEAIAALRTQPVGDDLLQRARAPLAAMLDDQLKTNAGWIGLVARAQSEPERFDRARHARDRLMAVTPAMIQAAAARYLIDERRVEVIVLPRTSAPPTP